MFCYNLDDNNFTHQFLQKQMKPLITINLDQLIHVPKEHWINFAQSNRKVSSYLTCHHCYHNVEEKRRVQGII